MDLDGWADVRRINALKEGWEVEACCTSSVGFQEKLKIDRPQTYFTWLGLPKAPS